MLEVLWEMSVTAAYAAAIVIVLRLLLKRRAPKQVLCLLWLVVFARLLIPVPLESPLSIVPDALPRQEQHAGLPGQPSGAENPATPIQPQAPAQDSAQTQPAGGTVIPVVDTPAVPTLSLPQGVTPSPLRPEAPAPNLWRAVLAGVWLAGAAALTLYALFSYFRLRRRLFDAIRAPDGAWEHPAVNSPFILGLVRPRIYLPAGLSGQPRQFILCHERAHLRRLDHIVKPVCWAALALHWFNPMVWAAYILMSRDIEAACDEAVIRRLGPKVKADYSATLLALATNRRVPAPCPLAFDEGDAKGRIKNVLRYRRPALWIVVVSVIAAVLAAVCLLTDPVAAREPDADPSPTASASQPPANLADTLLEPWMKEVLDGERQFISAYSQYNEGDGRTYGIHDLRTFYYGDDQFPDAVVEAGRVAVIDLDRDGVNELVIWPEGEYEYLYSQVGYAILRRQGDEIYAYNPVYRGFGDLKSDGTFSWSNGAAWGGYATLTFGPGEIVLHETTYHKPAEDNSIDQLYFVDGRQATQEEYGAAEGWQGLKPSLAWFTYDGGQLRPYLPAGAELLAGSGPDSTGTAKLWRGEYDHPWLEWNGTICQLMPTITAEMLPYLFVRDFDGDGQDELVIRSHLNYFGTYDVYEWSSGQVAYADSFNTQDDLLLRFNQNNVAAYNKDTRGFSVTYAHTEGDPDSADYYRHYVTGSCTLPEDFFNGFERIRDGYTYAYSNDFRQISFNSDNSIHFDLLLYPADETMKDLIRVVAPDYTGPETLEEHYMKGRAVGTAAFTLRYDGAKWVLQEPDQLNLDYQDGAGQTSIIPLSEYTLSAPVPGFLDADQQLLYRQAYALYYSLFPCSNDSAHFLPAQGVAEPAESVERYGITYAPEYGRFNRWDDFERAVLSVFTQDAWDAKNGPHATGGAPVYIGVDNRTYYISYGRGGGDYNGNFPETFRLVSQTDDAIEFVMTGHYSSPYPMEGESAEERNARLESRWEYSIDFPMRMVKTSDGWRFDQFYLAVTDDFGTPDLPRTPNPGATPDPYSIYTAAPLSAPVVDLMNGLPDDPNEWYKVAELPDDMIWVYSRNYGAETLIRWDGNFYKVFDQTAHTGLSISPQLKKLGDSDHYGPLAVISNVDQGTGVYQDQLVIYDLDAATGQMDYVHDWKPLVEDFNSSFSYRYDSSTHIFTLTYQGQTAELIIDGIEEPFRRLDEEGVRLAVTGDIVRYRFNEDGAFQIEFPLEAFIGDDVVSAPLIWPWFLRWTIRFNSETAEFETVPGSCELFTYVGQ